MGSMSINPPYTLMIRLSYSNTVSISYYMLFIAYCIYCTRSPEGECSKAASYAIRFRKRVAGSLPQKNTQTNEWALLTAFWLCQDIHQCFQPLQLLRQSLLTYRSKQPFSFILCNELNKLNVHHTFLRRLSNIICSPANI